MRDEGQGESATFGTWFRNARIRKGWTQDRVVSEADLSKSTLNRWENGKGIGDPATVRRACLAMGLDPREAAVAIGLVTREEWDLPPFPPTIDDALQEPASLLADERIPEPAKKDLRGLIATSVDLWKKRLGLRDIREPSAAERAKGQAPTRRR